MSAFKLKITARIAEIDRLEALRREWAPTHWGTLDRQRSEERAILVAKAGG